MPSVSISISVEISSCEEQLSGTWLGQATPIASSRSGFLSDTKIPEFTIELPERIDGVAAPQTSLELIESCGTVVGYYKDSQGLGKNNTCPVTGTYDSGTGAVSLAGSCGDWDVEIEAVFSGGQLVALESAGNGITVARSVGGSSSEVRDWTASRGDAVSLSGTHYYVDSLAGDDGSAGTSPAEPKATLAATWLLCSSGDTVHRARGSLWRESFGDESLELTVEDYGVGPSSVIDGTEILSSGGWTKTVGYSNIYHRTLDPEDDPNIGRFILLENGIPYQWVADPDDDLGAALTALDAIPSGCATPNVDGSGTYTIYIHQSGSTDPATSGKTVEASTRYGLRLKGSSTVRDGITRASIYNDGSLVVRSVDANDAPVFDSPLCLWGGKHNALVGGGTGTIRCLGAMPADSNCTMVVVNRSTANPVDFDLEVASVQLPAIALKTSSVSPFSCHGNGEGDAFGTAVLRGGSAYCNGSVNMNDCTTPSIEDYWPQKYVSTDTASAVVNLNSNLTIRRCPIYMHGTTLGVGGQRAVKDRAAIGAFTLTMEDCLITISAVNGGVLVFEEGSVVDAHYCTFAEYEQSSATTTFDEGSGDLDLRYHNCMFVNGLNRIAVFQTAGATGITSADENVVDPGTMSIRENSAAEFRAFSVYQGDQGILDQNSVYGSVAYEEGTDTGDYPTFVETAESKAALHPTFAAGYRYPFVESAAFIALRDFVESL